MEITSTNSLWKDYDINTLPFNASKLSEKTVNGIHTKEFYYDGFTTVDGRVRTYIKILENADPKGIVLYLGDRDCDNDTFTEKALFDMGYSVAVLDYLGERDSNARFTLYPKSLSRCKCYGKTEFHALSDALCSRWYIWTCIARKAVKFLRENYPDKKIVALGRGLGGSTVYKLASFDDGLTAAATVLNILPDVTGTGNPLIVYHASLDNLAYAPTAKIPLFMAVSSNDEDGSLDDMANLAENTVSLKTFRIIERAFSDSINAVFPQVKNFFDCTPDLPNAQIAAVNSEGKLYFNIKLNGDNGSSSVDLFTAFCVENPMNRNWLNIPAIKLGDGEYMANIAILQADKPVYAFVNVTAENGDVSSSKLLKFLPKSLGIASQPLKTQRVLYDSDMGKDVWTSRGGNIEIKNGPFDISGVTSDTFNLISFKPSDPLYRAEPDSMLQIILCGKPQTVTLELRTDTERYTAQIDLSESENWQKVNLSLSDFKGNTSLTDWGNINVLEFNASDEIIITSILWV